MRVHQLAGPAFVDGTLRTEARLTRTGPDGDGDVSMGLAGSWAAGAELVDGDEPARYQGSVDQVTTGRAAIFAGDRPVRLPDHRDGWRWEPYAVDGADVEAGMAAHRAHIAATVRPARTSWAPLAVMADAGGYRDRPVAPIGRRAAGRGLQDPATLMPMTGDGPQIVIKGRREDWPDGARMLTPREPGREPNRQTFWFGAELDPDGSQVWFRITSEAVRRMREGDAVARGERLVDALLAWLTPARRLGPEVNRFQVLVSDDGDTRLERYGGD